jgi:hypothetical protein
MVQEGEEDGEGSTSRRGQERKKVSMTELGYDLANVPESEDSRRKTFLKLPPHK